MRDGNMESTETENGEKQSITSESKEENETQASLNNGEQSETSKRKSSFFYLKPQVYVLIHILCLVIYIIPLVRTHPEYKPILDETHLGENGDVRGTTTISEVLRNDYWGRPMDAQNSHKSWRPLSILLFRFLRTEKKFMAPILFDRIIGLVIHAALAEIVSICACLLFPQSDKNRQSTLFACTKLLFAFHPTHVEAVSNAANRPHILALMFSILATDYRMPIFFVPFLVAFALTSCETATFQLPAILVTLTVIAWRK